jgi:trigger factor
MKVTQEKLPASQVVLEIELTPETTKQNYEEVIKNLASTANIPGFRRGKIPRPILLQHFGSARIKTTVLDKMISDGLKEAIEQEHIQVIGESTLRSSIDDLIKQYEPGKPLTISVLVDVYPQVEIPQYTNLNVKAEEVKYDPKQVEQILDQERQRRATLIPVEGRAAELGDVVVVDFKGLLTQSESENASGEPSPIPGGEETNFQVDLQEGEFIPGFVSGIVGMNMGETKEVPAKFPADYTNPVLAGKDAIFTVTLKEIKEKELAELNDEFAQEVGDLNSLSELLAHLEKVSRQQAQERTKTNQQEALVQEILKNATIELPETLIQNDIDIILQQTAVKLAQEGQDVNKLFTKEVVAIMREEVRPAAIERLKRGLIIQLIGERESINVPEQEIELKVKQILATYSEGERKNINVEQISSLVYNEVFTQKVLDWLLERSSVELTSAESATNQELAPASLRESVNDSVTEVPISTTATSEE